MASGFNAEYRTEYSANNLNLNQGSNAVLASFFMPRKAVIRRYGVIAEAAQGLLAPGKLNLAVAVAGGASATEVPNSTLAHGARARGIAVYGNLASRVEVNAGEIVQVRADTAAGGASTGRVWIEVEDQPYNGANIPASVVKATLAAS